MSKTSKLIVGAVAACMLAPIPALAASNQSWMVRTTAIGIFPNASSKGPLKLEVADEVSLAIDATYFVSPNWAIDVLATLVKPEIRTQSSTIAGVAGGDSLGSVGLVPPIVAVQYHLNPMGNLLPYVGLGFNANFFHDPNGDLSNLKVKVHDAIGFVAQLGVDYKMTKSMSLNADLKYLQFSSNVDVGANRSLDDKLKFRGVIVGLGLGFWI